MTSGPHLSDAARAPLPCGCHAPRRSRALRPLSGQHAARPDSLTPPASRSRLACLARAADSLTCTPHAASADSLARATVASRALPPPHPTRRRPTASRRTPLASPIAPPSRPSRRPNHRGPKPPTPSVVVPPAAHPSTSRRTAVLAPVSRPFLGRLSCAGVVPPLAHRAAPPLHALASCTTRCLGRPSWAAHAAPPEAERGFGPVAPGLNFIFSDLFNSLQIQNFV
jgi:hypothetical protein